MQLTTLKQRILDYTHNLTNYDYIAYGWLFAILICFLLLAIVLIGKKPKTSVFFMMIMLFVMIAGPFAIKYGLDQTIRKAVIVDENITELPFSKNLVVLGEVENRGKIDFNKCRVFLKVLKEDENRYKQLLYTLKPIRKKSVIINNVLKGQKVAYKIVLDRFSPKIKYLVKQSVECY